MRRACNAAGSGGQSFVSFQRSAAHAKRERRNAPSVALEWHNTPLPVGVSAVSAGLAMRAKQRGGEPA
jgi:hypothetical protein